MRNNNVAQRPSNSMQHKLIELLLKIENVYPKESQSQIRTAVVDLYVLGGFFF